MKKVVREKAILRTYVSSAMFEMRDASHLSQEQLAERLDLASRSYVDLEHGKSLCSTPTFIRFLSLVEDPRPMIRHCADLLDSLDDAAGDR